MRNNIDFYTGLLWKVYAGSKKSTKQPVSVFVLEKKSLELWTRTDRDAILDTLKAGVQQLTKIRHPRCLTVQHPLEESRDSIAFATEPIFASLANVLGDRQNGPANSTALKSFRLHEVEIKTGLLQLAEALQFLHTDARLLHRNVCPRSVIINKEGGWKLFGFEYCAAAATAPATATAITDPPAWSCRPYQPTLHPLLQPQLDYLAPEHVCLERNEPASDLFALATLIYALHSADHRPPQQFRDSVDAYRRYATDLEHGAYPNLGSLPAALADHVRLSLHARPAQRPTVFDMERLPYLCADHRVTTLNQLDTAFQWTNLQKSQFYKGLPTVLADLPGRIQLQHVLPALVREFAQPQMIPFVLPAFFRIAEQCTAAEYATQMHAPLKPVLRLQEPIQILLILVQHIELLLRQTPAAELQADVLPMLYRALETDQPQMQQMCLSVLPAFAKAVDQVTVRTGILPRIRALCTRPATSAALVVNGLVCLGHLLEYMDRWLVMDEVVPLLVQQMRGARDPPVIMAMVAILRRVLDSKRLGVTREVMAVKLVPFLMPLCVESGLAVDEFEVVVAMVKELVEQVEREQRARLEQLRGQRGGGQAVPSAVSPPVTAPLPTASPLSPMSTSGTSGRSADSGGSSSNNSGAVSPMAPADWTSGFGMPQNKQTQQQQQQRPNYNVDASPAAAAQHSLNGNMSHLTMRSPQTPLQSSTQPHAPRDLTASLSGTFTPMLAASKPPIANTTFQTKTPASKAAAWTQGGHTPNAPARLLPQTQACSPPLLLMQPSSAVNGNATKTSANQLTQQDILDFLN